jgi:glutamyl-tRNA reductase
MRVGVLGINHKLADLKLRESFAKVCQKRFSPSESMSLEHPLVLLSTCNRAEVYFSSDVLADTHSYLLNVLRDDLIDVSETFDQKLYSYFGIDCFQHLAQVAAGLDSAIVAETEIQGQVKNAYETSSGVMSLTQDLHFLFQKSLKIAKDVRTRFTLGRGMPDLEHAVLNTGLNFFGEPDKAKILVVGASDINEKIIAFFKGKNIKNITLCNRSGQRAHLLAEKYMLETLSWGRLGEWVDYDWIIFGTKASEFLITKKDIPQNMRGQKLVVDLCVPRNVEPKLGRDPRITLLNIDQIDRMLQIRKQRTLHLVSEAREVVFEAAKTQVDLFQEREKKREKFLQCA